METNTGACVAICVSLILFVGAGQLKAQTDFSDNFESYAAGSDLNGQGGWTTTAPTIFVQERAGAPGGGNHADGAYDFGSAGGFQTMSHPYDFALLPADAVVTMRAEVYARSPGEASAEGLPRTHNSGLGFNGFSVALYTNTNGESLQWHLDLRGVGGGTVLVAEDASLFDRIVDVEIVLDTSAGVGGRGPTAFATVDGISTSLPPVGEFYGIVDGLDFSSLTSVGQTIDFRGTAGVEIHSISVTIPEPSTMMLAGAGLFGLTLGWRRRRNR